MPLNQPPQVYTEAMQEKIHGFTRGDRVGWLQIHGAKVCETSFSHHFHVIFTDPWPTLCHAVPCCAKVRSLGQIFGARSFDVSWLLAHNFSYCSWG
jgi:hypothetical protein